MVDVSGGGHGISSLPVPSYELVLDPPPIFA